MEHQGDRGRLGQASEGTGQSACVTPAVWSMGKWVRAGQRFLELWLVT